LINNVELYGDRRSVTRDSAVCIAPGHSHSARRDSEN